jgi:hypothetical protein
VGEEINKIPLELERLKETRKKLLLKKGQILVALSRYLRQGSFPELIGEENVENARQYVASLLKKVIFEDIPRVFPIENPALLNEILKLIAKRPGMLLEYRSLASSLGMTRQTASKYIAILEEAFLVRILANYRKSALAVARKVKRAYLVAHAYALPFVDLEEVLARPSWLVENVVACHLDAKFFWRNAGEVDFVVKGAPIEVKCGKGENLKWVTKFMEKFSAGRGIVVTEDTLERKIVDAEGKRLEVLLVPLWLFLLSF